MGGMLDKFHAGIEKAFGAATDHRTLVTAIRKRADENPERLATKIMEVVPKRLKEARAIALEAVGIDVADAEAVRSFKTSSVAEWQLVSWLSTRHLIYGAFLRLVGQYFRDPNLTGVRSARAVCEAFIEATERHLYTVALDFYELQQRLPEESFPKEELAKVLSGIVATRTSLQYPRLRAAIDERRAHSREKSAKRERFEQLLFYDLPAQILDAYEEIVHPLSTLSEIRTELVRRLESRNKSRTASREDALAELADFADREKLARIAKAAKLSPQEFEFFELFSTGKKPKQVATQKGVTPEHARQVKHRIGHKLSAAGF